MRLWSRRTRPEPTVPRPDRTRIAVLEYELFGIEPKPGTVAAAVIGLRQFSAVLNGTDADRGRQP